MCYSPQACECWSMEGLLEFSHGTQTVWANQDLITGYISTRAQVRYSSLHPSVPRKASGFSEYGYSFGNC
jgi:hypothetical protein